jgi:hypothetical protein
MADGTAYETRELDLDKNSATATPSSATSTAADLVVGQ